MNLSFITSQRIRFAAFFSVFFGLAGYAPLWAALEAPTKPIAGLTETRRVLLSRESLRGYGSLGGQYIEYGLPTGGAVSSVLIIQTADVEKAKIILAKYRSDLRALGGVTEKTVTLESKPVPLLTVENQGHFLALRQGVTVVIVASQRIKELTAVLTALNFATQTGLDFFGATVPTYLDKFDRWGFGFWCQNPLLTPEKQEQTYDVREKFEWAKKMGVALQIDLQLNEGGGAQGVLEENSKRWSIDLAREMGIPISIQMQGAPAPGWITNRYADEMQQKIPQFVGSWYGVNGNNGFPGHPYGQLSWASVAGKNRLFADQYQAVRKYKDIPNLTGYGEWHGEIGEGPLAMFMD